MEQKTQAPLDSLLRTIKPGETPFTDDYLSNAADSALKQIDMVIHRCKGDDLNVRAMQNCRNGIAQLVEEMCHRLDHESSEYNNIMDVIEQLHEQLDIATQSVKALESSHEGVSATATAGITALQDELADLRLQLDKAEREKEQLIADFEQERIEVSAAGTQVALQLRRIQSESAEYRKELMLRDSGQDGETVYTTLSSAGHNIACRINTYLYQNAIALEEYRRSKLFNVQSKAIYNCEQRRKLKAMSKT